MIISEVTKQVKAKTPVKKAKGIQKDHPYKGQLVGEADRRPQKPKPYNGNPVAKNMNKFNKPATQIDKKKELKKGSVKHKGHEMDEAHGNSKVYDKCWDGYKKVPGKKRGEKGSCVKEADITEGPLVLSKTSDLMRMLDTLLQSWKSDDHSDDEYAELLKALGYKMEKDGDRTVLIKEAFKNTYDVGDRVDSPLGTGTIVAVSKNVNIDGKVKVKLDDPSKAGKDGEHKDSFVLLTTQLHHIDELEEATTAEVYKTNGKYWVVDVTGPKIKYTDWGPRGDGFASKEEAEAFAKKVTKEGLEEAPGAIRKGLAAVALIAGLWGVNNHMAQQAYDASPQLQKLTAYLEVAKQHNDQRMIKQLEDRIENHKTRLDVGKGDVMDKDGKPIDVVYDKKRGRNI